MVGDFVRYGGRRLGAAVVLMLVGGILEGVGLALLVPIFSLLAPQAGGRWRAMVVDALSSIGLGTRIEQLAAVLLAFSLQVCIRAIVLAARDRLVSDLSLGFVDHRRLMVVTDLAQARWSSLARLRHARIAHILSSEIARLALACTILLQIATSAIMLVTQAILMILLSPMVALLMTGLALLGLLVLIPLSRGAADIGTASTRFAFRIAGETAHFLGGLKIAVAHGMADVFVAQIGKESAGLRAIWRAEDRDPFAQAAVIATAAMMLHSLVDYPLRTAALSALFAACLGLMLGVRPMSAAAARPPRHDI